MERLRGLDRRQLIALGGGLATIVALLLIVAWGSGPAWVPVSAGVPLEQVGEVTRTLEEAKIEYRLGAGGMRVEVAEGARVRAVRPARVGDDRLHPADQLPARAGR